MRFGAIALVAASLLSASAVQAQTLQLGPGGVGVDMRSPRQRERDALREEERRERFRDRRRAERDFYRERERDCREVTVTRRNEYGERVTRTRRECR